MMDDYIGDDSITTMDLDVNQGPQNPGTNSMSRLGFPRMQMPSDPIEDRIRHLEAVFARARQRQRWRQARNHPQSNDALVNTIESTHNEGRGIVERTKGVKRDSSHLVAKALELDIEVKEVVGDGKGFFDCNICLDAVRDPILTCCGHLFCWACFYQLPFIYSMAKECPVCKGEVTDSKVTPIYGNGKEACMLASDSGTKIPPRPRASRVDSMRQHRVTRMATQIPVADALHRNRIGLGGALGNGAPQQEPMLAGPSRRHRSRLVARALSEASSPSIPIVMDGGEFLRGIDVAQPQIQAAGSTELANFRSDFDMLLEDPIPDSFAERSMNGPQLPSSSRRSNRISRVFGVDTEDSHDPMRRALG